MYVCLFLCAVFYLRLRQGLQFRGLRPLPQVPEQLIPKGNVEPVREQVQQAAESLQQRQAKFLDVREVLQHRAEARLEQVFGHARLVLELAVREDYLHQRRLRRVHDLFEVLFVFSRVGVKR